MKILNVYLQPVNNIKVLSSLNEFNTAVANGQEVVNTYCIKGLNFSYLGSFDKITIFGKCKHAEFTIEPTDDRFIHTSLFDNYSNARLKVNSDFYNADTLLEIADQDVLGLDKETKLSDLLQSKRNMFRQIIVSLDPKDPEINMIENDYYKQIIRLESEQIHNCSMIYTSNLDAISIDLFNYGYDIIVADSVKSYREGISFSRVSHFENDVLYTSVKNGFLKQRNGIKINNQVQLEKLLNKGQ